MKQLINKSQPPELQRFRNFANRCIQIREIGAFLTLSRFGRAIWMAKTQLRRTIAGLTGGTLTTMLLARQ